MNAEKLNAIRKEKALSIEELSNLANLPKSTVERFCLALSNTLALTLCKP